MYGASGSLSDLERAFELESIDREPYIDKVITDYDERWGYDTWTVKFLVKFGRIDEAERIIRNVNYRSKVDWKGYEFSNITILSNMLSNKGRYDTAAKVCRNVIDSVLGANDSKNYERTADLLRMMGRDENYERATVPHSQYLKELRENTPRKTKFWGIYDGTYVKKSRTYR